MREAHSTRQDHFYTNMTLLVQRSAQAQSLVKP